MITARRRPLLILALACGLLLPLAARGLTCDWTGAANTDWDNPANWSNCGGGIPGAADTAVITAVPNQPSVFSVTPVGGVSLDSGTALTIANGGNLTLDGPASGAGNITVAVGTLTWLSGAMSGTGSTTIASGGLLSLPNTASKVLSRNLVNGGFTTMTGGTSSLNITSGVTFTNLGLFEIQNGSDITGSGDFVNQGTFRVSASPDTVSVAVTTWVSSGTVDVQTGATLSIAPGTATHGGTYTAFRLQLATGSHTVTGSLAANQLILNAPVVFVPSSTLQGPSLLEVRANVSFDTGEPFIVTTLLHETGTITGADSFTVIFYTWEAGTLAGSGTTSTLYGGTTSLAGPANRILDRDFVHSGVATMSGAPGTLTIASDRTFLNTGLGTISIQNDFAILGEAVFENAGYFWRTTSSGTAIVDVDFRNHAIVSLQSGTTIFHEYTQTAGTTELAGGNLGVVHELLELEGGLLKGIGTIDASVVASGNAFVLPGTSPGELTISGGYRQSEPATYSVQLDGTGAGQFDQLVVSGQATLGGTLDVVLTFVPPPSASFPVLTYASRVGEFFEIDLPPPPAGLSWLARYGATQFSLRLQSLLPTDPLLVDSLGVPGGTSNHNSVLEPGEIVTVAPTWFNPNAAPSAVTGTASNFTGPAGAIYGIVDGTAVYDTIPGSPLEMSCDEVGTEDCYFLTVDDPLVRPALHWDATFDEALSGGSEATYTVHVGESFADVAPAHPFYLFIETLLHNQVTAGCSSDSYCPGSSVTRAQMAVFLLVSRFGASYLPPDASGAVFTDVPVGSFAAAFIEDLAARQITSGCDASLYCPTDYVTREQMAVFLLRTLEGPTYVPPDCVTPTFTDVPCSSGFAKWVNEIALRGITAGCGPPGLFCPGQPVSRGQMAVFLTATFSLVSNSAY